MTTLTKAAPKAAPKADQVLSNLEKIQAWPHWDEIGLCATKEYGLSPEQFQERLPEYQRFMALNTVYTGLGMTSEAVDQVWHSHILHTELYDKFCEVIGRKIHHMPCSSYALYGVTFDEAADDCQSSMCRVPTTCYGKLVDEFDSAAIAASIRNGAQGFRDAYQQVFGVIPPIWDRRNQIADGLAI